MTKPTSIKTADFDKFDNLTLHQIEQTIKDLEKETGTFARGQLHAARQALRNRQRYIKAEAMDFEERNDHHLLFFDSTAGFSKLAGHSVLFFSMAISHRIGWRTVAKVDTDHYCISEDGIISFRSLSQISSLLATIGIFPDQELTTSELHFYKLEKVYTREQIATLRDKSGRSLDKIETMTLPDSPLPSLYIAITDAYDQIFREFSQISNGLARQTIGERMILESYEMTLHYHLYAFYRNHKAPEQHLLKIADLARRLRFGMAYVSHLHILHQKSICHILENLLIVERLSSSAYRKARDKIATEQT